MFDRQTVPSLNETSVWIALPKYVESTMVPGRLLAPESGTPTRTFSGRTISVTCVSTQSPAIDGTLNLKPPTCALRTPLQIDVTIPVTRFVLPRKCAPNSSLVDSHNSRAPPV